MLIKLGVILAVLHVAAGEDKKLEWGKCKNSVAWQLPIFRSHLARHEANLNCHVGHELPWFFNCFPLMHIYLWIGYIILNVNFIYRGVLLQSIMQYVYHHWEIWNKCSDDDWWDQVGEIYIIILFKFRCIIIVLCNCAIATIFFGSRFGLFLILLSQDFSCVTKCQFIVCNYF